MDITDTKTGTCVTELATYIANSLCTIINCNILINIIYVAMTCSYCTYTQQVNIYFSSNYTHLPTLS